MFLLGVCGFIAAHIYFAESERQQQELLALVRATGAANMESVRFFAGHDPRNNVICLEVNAPGLLAEFALFLSQADATYYGGHQSQKLPLRILIKGRDGNETKYLFRAFDRYPHDVFLNRDRYTVHDDGSHSLIGEEMIRVPGLLPWLQAVAANSKCLARPN